MSTMKMATQFATSGGIPFRNPHSSGGGFENRRQLSSVPLSMAMVSAHHQPIHHPIDSSNQSSSALASSVLNSTTSSILMSRLYTKSEQMKSWGELTKTMKQNLLEKRPIATDANDRLQLQRCLDTIQKNIEVKSVQSLVERLETICRQLKLKFTCPRNNECFVHSEMYYVEIKLDIESGRVLDCKVAHQAHEAETCSELIDVLRRGDFVEFTKHLEGLSAIYQIDTDKKVKEKAYLALHALEKDLIELSEVQKNQINDISNIVHKSPAGVLQSRRGGHPMKLTFFVPPYDLIDLNTKTALPLTVETILERKLGYSATVCIEESSIPHKLQVESLVSVKYEGGKAMPLIQAHMPSNTTQLPACFVLRLTRSLPICVELAAKLSKLTGIEFPHLQSEQSNFITLLATQQLNGSTSTTYQSSLTSKVTKFVATLPKQKHCYYVNSHSEDMKGILIDKIPFTHPTHVSKILFFIRQQVLFNVILGSIIRQTQEKDNDMLIFEVFYSSLSNIYIQFEHPCEQSLATMDVDIRDFTNVRCKLYPSLPVFGCTDDYATKIMQKTLSIPVTMRSIVNRAREAMNKEKSMVDESKRPEATAGSIPAPNEPEIEGVVEVKNEPCEATTTTTALEQPSKSNGQNQSWLMYHQQQFNENKSTNLSPSQQQRILSNMNKKQAQLLSKQQSQQQGALSALSSSSNTMLMQMLSDIPHASQPVKSRKRKRLSSASEVDNSKKRLEEDEVYSSSISSTDSSEVQSSEGMQYYSIKSGEDGHSEQLKIIKQLEEISQKDDVSKFKGEKIQSIRIKQSPKVVVSSAASSNASNKPDIEFIEPTSSSTVVRKERKRKRADSAENFTAANSFLNTPTSLAELNRVQVNSNANFNRSMSQIVNSNSNQMTPPKVKKSSSSPITSPTLPSYQKSIQGLKLTSMLNQNKGAVTKLGGGQFSMLPSSKMMDFETAAAAMVAASSGGSAATAMAAASAAVSSSPRYIKPIKPKVVISGGNGTKPTPITLNISPSTSPVGRLKDSKTGPLGMAQKIKGASFNAISSVSGMTSPKMLQQQPSLPSGTGGGASMGASLLSGVGKLALNAKGKNKSLTSVVDRLRQQNAADGGPLPVPVSNSGNFTLTQTSPDSSASSISAVSKSMSKSSESKMSKYTQSQFTIKQGNSGLKMSITKTKPSQSSVPTSAAELLSKIGPAGTGLFKNATTKYTIPKIPKNNAPNSSVTSSTSTLSSSTSPTSSSITSGGILPAKKLPISSNNGISSGINSMAIDRNRLSPKNSIVGQAGSAGKASLFKNPELSFKTGGALSLASMRNISSGLFNHAPKNFAMGNTWASEKTSPPPPSSMAPSVSTDSLYGTGELRNQVTSSDGGKLATSTPSSPVECSPLPEHKNQPPLIIPTEAIPEEKASSSTSQESVSTPMDFTLNTSFEESSISTVKRRHSEDLSTDLPLLKSDNLYGCSPENRPSASQDIAKEESSILTTEA